MGPRSYTRDEHATIDKSHLSDPFGRSVTPAGYPIATWDAATGEKKADRSMGYAWFGYESFLIIFPPDMDIMLLEYITGYYTRHVHPFEFFDTYDPLLLDDRRLALRGDNQSGLAARRTGYTSHTEVQQWVARDWALEAHASSPIHGRLHVYR
jgi:hypothetical protein